MVLKTLGYSLPCTDKE